MPYKVFFGPKSHDEPTPHPAAVEAIPSAVAIAPEAADRHVYFYSDVDVQSCLGLSKQLRALDVRLRTERLQRDLSDYALSTDVPPVPIWLHIQSDGGDLSAAFGMADTIRLLSTPVYSVVEGVVASAGTILSAACHERFILPNAYIMIHQLSGLAWGKHQEVVDAMVLWDGLMAQLVAFYEARTLMNAEAVREKLSRDTWLNAGQAIELGLVDRLLRREER